MGAGMTAWVPLQAPSVNSLLYCIRGRHEPRPEVRLFRSQLKSYLPVWVGASSGPYSLSVAFHENWYFKNGFPKKKDVQNLVKAVCDAVAERYGFDDALLWEVRCVKINDVQQVGLRLTLGDAADVATSDPLAESPRPDSD